jgi:ABC-2 type transport system permease protein
MSAAAEAGGNADRARSVETAERPHLVRINLIGLATIVRREIRRIVRIWLQTIVPPAITMTLYFVIFGSLIGQRIGEMDGVPYTSFIAPGLIMMAVITNSFGNVVSSFFSGKMQMHLEEMLVSPMSYASIVVGYVTGGVARGLMVGGLVTLVALFFADLGIAHPLVTVSVIVLTSVVFSLGGLLNALFAKTFDDISIIPTFVLAPLTYLGGVFFSTALLPPFWQSVALANPILYMVNAFRYGMLGRSDIPLAYAFGIIVTAVVVLFVLAMILLKRGVGIRT